MTQIHQMRLREESGDRYVVYLSGLTLVGGLTLALLQMVLPVMQLGLPAVVVWGLFRYVRNAQGQLKRRLNSCFYQILQQNQGRVMTLDFAMMSHLSAIAARKFLDDKAREFSAQFEVTECGEVVYLFPRMNLPQNLAPNLTSTLQASLPLELSVQESAIQAAFDQLLASRTEGKVSEIPPEILESTQAFICETRVDAAVDALAVGDQAEIAPLAQAELAAELTLNQLATEPAMVEPTTALVTNCTTEALSPSDAIAMEPSCPDPWLEDWSQAGLSQGALSPELTFSESIVLEDMSPEIEPADLSEIAQEAEIVQEAEVAQELFDPAIQDDADQTIPIVPLAALLSQTALAKRLGVSTSTLSRRKGLPDLEEWSQAKDPEGIAWQYLAEAQSFAPVPEF